MHKILVIEDNFLLLDLINELLLLSGFHAITTSNYQEGHELLTVEQPNLVLCNYPFFDLDNLTILQNLCDDAAIHNTPLLFMLGYQIIRMPKLHLMTKNYETVVKPFPSVILLKKIYNLLQISTNASKAGLIVNQV
ncbi:hypothetical protein CLI64_25645 [Nostoc sp. CENA543]|uniref:response regulator n=1 Tax=Nostoc sp. CENA543 TaxID=1869241 RepID=UPI000CA0CCCB|nr:response regulator [Nostoc sp. CENA543]AUT03515.1 hypothetical protein CLI64_25645 [Nostoc sp. CENA543]